MPPKKSSAPAEPTSKKTDQKKKEKIVEDKTFGLKNKKGKKQQTFIKNVTHQVVHGDQKVAQMKKEQDAKEKQKLEKKALADELNSLFKPVQEQKVAKGVDPKSVLCAFFKSGTCTKGHKCKFSHDLNIERKAEKRNVYEEQSEKEDNMDDWDEEKLEEVVNTKHGESNKTKPQTSIICKYFLEAVENNKYGWFWACPNGESCHYRHALPQGFMLKKDAKRMADQEVKISIEQLVEAERAALSSRDLTKVTLDSFLKWKERKRREKQAALLAEQDKKKKDFKQGQFLGVSGREMFEFNPDLMQGDDDEADDIVYTREDDDEECEGGVVRELTLDMLAAEAATEREGPAAPQTHPTCNGMLDEAHLSGEASAAPPCGAAADTAAVIAAAMAAMHGLELAADDDIDENLFDGEDLDMVDDELDELEMDDD